MSARAQDFFEPRFVLRRAIGAAERRALSSGKTTRESELGRTAIYTPVRVKPRYWTSQTLLGSVIHIATGRGTLIQGDVATRGHINVEPYCYGRVEWARPLTSPADLPDRRLCGPCLERAHKAVPGNFSQPAPLRAITVHITAA